MVGGIVGRPRLYTQELAEKICLKVATTPGSLKRICAENPDFPDNSTIRIWCVHNKEFSAMYLEAKRQQIHAYVDECYDLIDECQQSPTSEMVAWTNMAVNLRKWSAVRLLPRLYNDRTYVAEGGKEIVQEAAEDTQRRIEKHQRDS